MPETIQPPRRVFEIQTFVETEQVEEGKQPDPSKTLALNVLKPLGGGKAIFTATVNVQVQTDRGPIAIPQQVVLNADSISKAFRELEKAIPEIHKKVMEQLAQPRIAMPGDPDPMAMRARMPGPNGMSRM